MKEQETKKGLLAKLQSGKLLEVLVILILAIIVIIILYNAFYKDKEDVSASGKGDYATEQEAKLVSVLSQTRRRGQSAGNDQPCRRGRNGDRLRNRAKSGRHDRHDARARKRRGGRSGKAAARDCGVLIVAEGAENLAVRFNLIDAAASVLNINKSIIKVYENGSGK